MINPSKLKAMLDALRSSPSKDKAALEVEKLFESLAAIVNLVYDQNPKSVPHFKYEVTKFSDLDFKIVQFRIILGRIQAANPDFQIKFDAYSWLEDFAREPGTAAKIGKSKIEFSDAMMSYYASIVGKSEAEALIAPLWLNLSENKETKIKALDRERVKREFTGTTVRHSVAVKELEKKHLEHLQEEQRAKNRKQPPPVPVTVRELEESEFSKRYKELLDQLDAICDTEKAKRVVMLNGAIGAFVTMASTQAKGGLNVLELAFLARVQDISSSEDSPLSYAYLQKHNPDDWQKIKVGEAQRHAVVAMRKELPYLMTMGNFSSFETELLELCDGIRASYRESIGANKFPLRMELHNKVAALIDKHTASGLLDTFDKRLIIERLRPLIADGAILAKPNAANIDIRIKEKDAKALALMAVKIKDEVVSYLGKLAAGEIKGRPVPGKNRGGSGVGDIA